MDIALACVMRDAMLRVPEAAALVWQDVRPARGGGILSVPQLYPSRKDRSAAYLSGASMQALMAVRPDPPEPRAEVFRLSERRIREAAGAAELEGRYTGDSPRVGMAMDLASAGYQPTVALTTEGWASPSMPGRALRPGNGHAETMYRRLQVSAGRGRG